MPNRPCWRSNLADLSIQKAYRLLADSAKESSRNNVYRVREDVIDYET